MLGEGSHRTTKDTSSQVHVSGQMAPHGVTIDPIRMRKQKQTAGNSNLGNTILGMTKEIPLAAAPPLCLRLGLRIGDLTGGGEADEVTAAAGGGGVPSEVL